MRKNSIDNKPLCNRNFGLVCVSGFLLYATAYAVLLPLMRSGLAADICFPFVIGIQLAGAFNAWLADKFRRRHVLAYPFAGMLLVAVGYAYASTPHQYMALALLHGICFGLATSAALTLSIDVVHTGNRTRANMVYAFVSRLGMVVGGTAGLWLMPLSTYHWLGPVLAGAAGVLAASWMYVPFRLVLPMLGGMAWLFLLAVLAPWLVRMFVKLSHHCQRATGNVTFNLFVDAGLLFGVAYAQAVGAFPLWEPFAWMALAGAMYLCITRIYYKKKRVR